MHVSRSDVFAEFVPHRVRKSRVQVVDEKESLATSKRFVEEGAYVFIMGRRQAELHKAMAEIGKNVS